MRIVEWRAVPDWPAYEVSSNGEVRSLYRASTNRAGIRRNLRGRLLAPSPNSDGYLMVTLYMGVQSRTFSVSNLVALAFLGPRPFGHVVCHGDGDKRNNTVENLRYDTVTENNRDRLRHGTNPQRRKTHCPQGHPYDEANTYWYAGHRQCLTCRRARALATYRAKKESA